MSGEITINHETPGFHDALLRHTAILNLFENDIPYKEMTHEQAGRILQDLLTEDFPDHTLIERLKQEGISDAQFQLHRAVLSEAAGYVLAGEHAAMVPSSYSTVESGELKNVDINSDPVFQAALYLASNLHLGGRQDLFSMLTPHSSIAGTVQRALTRLPENTRDLQGQGIEWLHIGPEET